MRKREPGESRACRKCGVMFSTHRCLDCAKANSTSWRAANPGKAQEHRKSWVTSPEKRQATALVYRQGNRERLAAKTASYRAANPEKAREAVRRWQAENPEKKRQAEAAYRAKNVERNRQNVSAWAKLYPGRRNAIQQNRRARKLSAGGSLSPGLAEKLLVLQKGKCACCGASLDAGYNLDHITPLAAGGSNEDWNIQLLTPSCNAIKAAKDPVVFMQSRGFLI